MILSKRLQYTAATSPRPFAVLPVSSLLLVGGSDTDDTRLGLDLVSNQQVEQIEVETWQRIDDETAPSGGG